MAERDNKRNENKCQPPLSVAGPTSQIPRIAPKPRQTGQERCARHSSNLHPSILSLSLLFYTQKSNNVTHRQSGVGKKHTIKHKNSKW
jgi:hypothetical protein